ALTVPCHNLRMLRTVAIFAIAVSVPAGAHAQQVSSSHEPHATVTAVRTSTPPVIDGRLNDPAWSQATSAPALTQHDPNDGQPATERTEVRVLYDDDAVYVGVRMFDSDAAHISRRLTNRDDGPDADSVAILFDPRHDHLTGAEFIVSAAGVQRDAIISNDTREDSSWDAVGGSAVSIDDQGWTAEFRIPLSQLRFTATEHQTWGFTVARVIRRKTDTDWLEDVRKQDAG